MRHIAIALDLFWIVLGGFLAAASARLGLVDATGPSTGFFPFVAGVVLAGGGVVQLVGALRSRITEPFFQSGPGARKVLLTVAAIAALVASMPRLGFAVPAVVTMVLLLSLLERRRPLAVLALAVVATGASWLLFGKLLGTPLPRGPWGF